MLHQRRVHKKSNHNCFTNAEFIKNQIIIGSPSFRKLRDMTKIIADSKREFPSKAPSAKQLSSILRQHDPKLYARSKDEIITIFESISKECNYLEEDSILMLSGAFSLFDTCMKQVLQLKEIEALRADSIIKSEELSTPSELAIEIKPDLTYLHTHLIKVAEMNEQVYQDALASIDAHLAPIITRVKARLTRAEHATEQLRELENE